MLKYFLIYTVLCYLLHTFAPRQGNEDLWEITFIYDNIFNSANYVRISYLLLHILH